MHEGLKKRDIFGELWFQKKSIYFNAPARLKQVPIQ
jgi:hypothetical protein